MKELGVRIREALNGLGITQRELSERCGTTEVSISRYIRDIREPSAAMLVLIAKALGVTPNWLLGFVEPSVETNTGTWVESNPQNSPVCRLIACSECGDTYIVSMGVPYEDWIDGRNYCRRCGAKLNGR